MHPNEQLLQQFYTSFQKLDYEDVKACYHPEIEFRDNAFGDLKGKRVGAMWHMLFSGVTPDAPLQFTFSNIQADEQQGSASLEARYKFSLTGRQVHNKIQSTFQFQDGKIIRQIDRFDFWRWSRQAFGTTGLLLGWMPWFRHKFQTTANKRLDQFIARNPDYQ